MSAALSVRAVSRTFRAGDGPALDGFDLEVPGGGCVALVGPSGSGKSTALRIVAGLDTPDSGDVVIDGTSVLGVPAEDRRAALVAQRPRLFPHLSVLDNVAFAARAGGASRRDSRADADRYLDLVQLSGFGRRRVGELSGGQEQRVAVARALASRPRVLLLDEPFSALDAPLRTEMHELLHELRAVLEPTVVLVTHDLAEAAAVADSVAVMTAGRVLQHAEVAELYLRPASLAVSRLTGGRNEIPGVVRDGVHHSVLGPLALPVDRTRRSGPAVLVVRQESVVLTGAADPDADVYGEVVEVRVAGARTVITVAVGPDGSAQADVVLEVPPGRHVARGQQVGLVLPLGSRAVVDPVDDLAGPSARSRVSPVGRISSDVRPGGP